MEQINSVTILALSGSLRRVSLNTTLLRAASLVAPDGTDIILYDGIGNLPLFNPDLDGLEPEAVIIFRQAVAAADGVLISSPEYAHGISGVMKNALDWLVGSGELAFGKPVAVLNASYSSAFADPQLREVLRTMDARLIEEASVSIPIQGRRLTAEQLIADRVLWSKLRLTVEAFVQSIRERPQVLVQIE